MLITLRFFMFFILILNTVYYIVIYLSCRLISLDKVNINDNLRHIYIFILIEMTRHLMSHYKIIEKIRLKHTVVCT